jgi:hypothetical protein
LEKIDVFFCSKVHASVQDPEEGCDVVFLLCLAVLILY